LNAEELQHDDLVIDLMDQNAEWHAEVEEHIKSCKILCPGMLIDVLVWWCGNEICGQWGCTKKRGQMSAEATVIRDAKDRVTRATIQGGLKSSDTYVLVPTSYLQRVGSGVPPGKLVFYAHCEVEPLRSLHLIDDVGSVPIGTMRAFLSPRLYADIVLIVADARNVLTFDGQVRLNGNTEDEVVEEIRHILDAPHARDRRDQRDARENAQGSQAEELPLVHSQVQVTTSHFRIPCDVSAFAPRAAAACWWLQAVVSQGRVVGMVSEVLLAEVKRWFYAQDGFADEAFAFADQHADFFEAARNYFDMGGEEHRLDWTELHQTFLADFSGRLEAFLALRGSDLEGLGAAVEAADLGDDPQAAVMVQLMLNMADYEPWLQSMLTLVEERRKEAADASGSETGPEPPAEPAQSADDLDAFIQAAAMALEIGRGLGGELKVPVFFYGAAREAGLKIDPP
ncbi:unnamed protein product, partial [Symbiodinium microadriaticum]